MTKNELKTLASHVDNLAAARDFIDDLKNELQDTYEGKSDKWPEFDKGEEMQERIDTLDELYNTLDYAHD